MAAASTSLLIRVLALSLQCAKRAGEIIRSVHESGNLSIVDKGIDDPQTEADRRCELCIIGSLHAQFPNITIVGEEGLGGGTSDIVKEFDESILAIKCPPEFSNIEEKDIIIYVDPLDGTKEYTDGFIKNVTVLIGISVHNSSIAGVVHQPFYAGDKKGRTIWGLVGHGAIGLTPKTDIELDVHKVRRVALTRTHLTTATQNLVKALNPTEIIHTGGAGNKSLLVAEKMVDFYVYNEPKVKLWDICAMDAVLKCVGGCATNLFGQPFRYLNGSAGGDSCVLWGGLLVSINSEYHQWLLNNMPEDLKTNVKPYPKL